MSFGPILSFECPSTDTIVKTSKPSFSMPVSFICLSFQIMLRVKETEVIHLQQEISTLKNELESAKTVSMIS